ncbi:dihydrodipicolinate synthase family protein [Nocardia sp. NPDC050713]|uniref:dihydrodipicolinate synthase family protein n=1 Tax=Nocardia sp. NPDC050713 TaxID=3154511 RepID=UPI0033F5E9CA
MTVGEPAQSAPRWPGAVEPNPILATVTPFARDGAIDTGALGEYLGFLHSSGVPAILVNGTTGEFASLTVAERKSVLEHAREHWSGHLIAHIGATAYGDALELLDHAKHHADAVAAIAPYFFADPPEAGVREFFGALLTRTELPMLLYNFPRHTQTPISPALLAALAAEYPMLAGIKDSGGDLEVTRAYAATGSTVLVGSDGAAARIRELGVHGIVSGGGNPVPELPVRIAAAVRDGDVDSAARWQAVFDECRALRHDSGLSDIAFVKAALAERIPGFPSAVRSPLLTAGDAAIAEIRAYLRDQILPRVHEGTP